MRRRTVAVALLSMTLWCGSGHAQETVLAIEDVCASAGETALLRVNLDNNALGEVGGAEMTIGFNKNVFAVLDVDKTYRSEWIDIFDHNDVPEGIKVAFGGFGHAIEPGTGPIIDVIVEIDPDAPDGTYDWTLSETILVDPLGDEIPHTAYGGTFGIPCGVGTNSDAQDLLPSHHVLSQNRPNPFNPITTIRYALPVSGERRVLTGPIHTILKIYNILGQEVTTLVDEAQEPGYYAITWDGRDTLGRQAATGVYYYRLTVADFTHTKRMVLLK